MSAVCPVNFRRSELPQGSCQNCGFLAWCLPADLTLREANRFNERIVHRRPIKRNEYLHHAGAALTSLNVINSGFLKTSITNGSGHEQITGFSMSGELVGMDAIGATRHLCNTVALEDSHLCGIAFSDFEQLTRNIPALQQHFHRAMGAEITRDYGIMLLLGGMRAEERVAMFLLNISKRFTARGYSGVRFRLPMTRYEIGNYLGLKLETVSRVFSRLDDIELIAINGKEIEIKNLAQLQQRIGAGA
jgi:CRP/FNR family transcriptional regulator